jgi:hypothetical protein
LSKFSKFNAEGHIKYLQSRVLEQKRWWQIMAAFAACSIIAWDDAFRRIGWADQPVMAVMMVVIFCYLWAEGIHGIFSLLKQLIRAISALVCTAIMADDYLTAGSGIADNWIAGLLAVGMTVFTLLDFGFQSVKAKVYNSINAKRVAEAAAEGYIPDYNKQGIWQGIQPLNDEQPEPEPIRRPEPEPVPSGRALPPRYDRPPASPRPSSELVPVGRGSYPSDNYPRPGAYQPRRRPAYPPRQYQDPDYY